MQMNKNGIPVQTSKKKRQRKPLNIELGKRSFISTIEGVEVVAVVPHFLPIIDVLIKDGWSELNANRWNE